MLLAIELPVDEDKEEQKKCCSDFDEDCVLVKDHQQCHSGSVMIFIEKYIYVEPSDGFCPFLRETLNDNLF